MSVLVGTQEVLKLQNKEPGKARPANRDQSAVEGCPRAAYGCIGGLLQTTPRIDWPGHLPGGRQTGSHPASPTGLVLRSRLLVRKSSPEEMRVSRYSSSREQLESGSPLTQEL